MNPARLAGLLVVAALLLGCTSDWPLVGEEIGPLVSCDTKECQALVPLAVCEFDRSHPGHAPVVTATLHEWLPARDLVYSGGPPKVVVIELADLSSRAIMVKGRVGAPPFMFEMGDDGRGHEPICEDLWPAP